MLADRLPRHWVLILLAVVAALAAAVYARALQPWGPWAYTDSAAYVDTARHILAGEGWLSTQSDGRETLLTHYPPGYPALLAGAMALTGGDWIAAGRLLDVASLGAFLLLVGWWLYEASSVPCLGLLAMVMLAVSLPTARAFTSLMSEPPFLVLLAAWLYALWRHGRGDGEGWRWVAVVLAGAAVLVRYAGLHAGLVVVLAPLLWGSASLWQRVQRAAANGVVFLLPFAAWMGYARLAGNVPGGFTSPAVWPRAFGEFLAATARTFLAALFPHWVHPPYGMVAAFWAAVLAVAVLWVVVWRRSRKEASPLTLLALLVVLDALAWFPFLAFMAVFVAPPPVLDFRMYTPAFLMGLVGGLAALAAWLLARPRPGPRGVAVLAVAAMLGLALGVKSPQSATHQALLTMRYFGEGYTARPWHESMAAGVLHAVAAAPPDVPLYSNNWPGVLIWLGRPALALRELPRYLTWDEAARRDARLAQWRREGGVVVLLWQAGRDRSRLWWKALLKRGGAFPCRSDAVGAIYCDPQTLESLP